MLGNPFSGQAAVKRGWVYFAEARQGLEGRIVRIGIKIRIAILVITGIVQE